MTSNIIDISWGILGTTGSLRSLFLSHHVVTGRRTIRLDNEIVVDEKKFVDAGSIHPLECLNGDVITLSIVSIRMGTAYRYDVFVNGVNLKEHNDEYFKHVQIWDLSSAFVHDTSSESESSSSSILLSCLVPDIMEVYQTFYQSRVQKEGMLNQSDKRDRSAESSSGENSKSSTGEANESAATCSYGSTSSSTFLVPSQIGFGDEEDVEFEGVVHDCELQGRENGDPLVTCRLYVNNVQCLYFVKCNGVIMPCLSKEEMLERSPEFAEPQAYRKRKKGSPGTCRK